MVLYIVFFRSHILRRPENVIIFIYLVPRHYFLSSLCEYCRLKMNFIGVKLSRDFDPYRYSLPYMCSG